MSSGVGIAERSVLSQSLRRAQIVEIFWERQTNGRVISEKEIIIIVNEAIPNTVPIIVNQGSDAFNR